MRISTLLLIACTALPGCKTSQMATSGGDTIDAAYAQSIQEAMSPGPEKVYSQLVGINPQNQNLVWKDVDGNRYLKMVAWKARKDFYEPYLDSAFYNTGTFPVWVTTAPELLRRMKTLAPEDPNLRLRQLLGLPPNAEYNYFIEFWVRPADLFRPCPDKEIDDSECELCFSEEDQTDEHHVNWINDLRVNSYYACELYNKYPWTQLGYTYDWHPDNKSHVGLSEFVIRADKDIIIEAIYTTEEYLALDPSTSN